MWFFSAHVEHHGAFPTYQAELEGQSIEVFELDIETNRFSFEYVSVGVVIADLAASILYIVQQTSPSDYRQGLQR